MLSLHDFDVKGDKLELDKKKFDSELQKYVNMQNRPRYTIESNSIDYANMTRIILNLRNMTCVGFDFLKCKQCQ